MMGCGCLTHNHSLKPKQCMPKQTTYHIRRVLEYSEFFKDASPIDIPATLKLYNRNTLLRMAAILSLHYGNMHVPDNERSLFSDCSKKHIPHINELFQLYYKRIGLDSNEKVRRHRTNWLLRFIRRHRMKKGGNPQGLPPWTINNLIRWLLMKVNPIQAFFWGESQKKPEKKEVEKMRNIYHVELIDCSTGSNK